MDRLQFGRAYPDYFDLDSRMSKERQQLLEAPRHWMRVFDTTLSSYLQGNPAPHRGDFQSRLDQYATWAANDLPDINAQFSTLLRTETHHSSQGELIFHHINNNILPLWNTALYAEEQSEDQLTAMQIQLAITAAPLVQRFREHVERDEAPDEVSRITIGTANEIDAMVVNLEVMKNLENVTFLPAPARYESNNHAKHNRLNRNIDFIGIDYLLHHARGIQVKTRIPTMKDALQYDNNFVTLIDAEIDLGNTALINRRIRHQPGLISMGVLATAAAKHVPSSINAAEYQHSLAIAQDVTRGMKSFLYQAADNVEEKILSDLYRQPATKKTSS